MLGKILGLIVAETTITGVTAGVKERRQGQAETAAKAEEQEQFRAWEGGTMLRLGPDSQTHAADELPPNMRWRVTALGSTVQISLVRRGPWGWIAEGALDVGPAEEDVQKGKAWLLHKYNERRTAEALARKHST